MYLLLILLQVCLLWPENTYSEEQESDVSAIPLFIAREFMRQPDLGKRNAFIPPNLCRLSGTQCMGKRKRDGAK